jgi:hypothetical protein
MSRILDRTPSVARRPFASVLSDFLHTPTNSSESATSNGHLSIEENSLNFENTTIISSNNDPIMPTKVTRPSHENAPMYSTRATKRKIDDVAPSPEKKVPSRSSRRISQDDSENESLPPAKRKKKSLSSDESSPAAVVRIQTQQLFPVPSLILFLIVFSDHY